MFNISHDAHFRNSRHGDGGAEHPEALLPLVSALCFRLAIHCLTVLLDLKVIIVLLDFSVLPRTRYFEGLRATCDHKVYNSEGEAQNGRDVRRSPETYSFRHKRTISWRYDLTETEERVEDSCR